MNPGQLATWVDKPFYQFGTVCAYPAFIPFKDPKKSEENLLTEKAVTCENLEDGEILFDNGRRSSLVDFLEDEGIWPIVNGLNGLQLSCDTSVVTPPNKRLKQKETCSSVKRCSRKIWRYWMMKPKKLFD